MPLHHRAHAVEQRARLGDAQAGAGGPHHQGEAAAVGMHVEPVHVAREALLDLLAGQRVLRVHPVGGGVGSAVLRRRIFLVVELHRERIRRDGAPADLRAQIVARPLQVDERDEERPVLDVPGLDAAHVPVHCPDLSGAQGEEVAGQLGRKRLGRGEPLRPVERFEVHEHRAVAADALHHLLDEAHRRQVGREQFLEAGADLQPRGEPDRDGRDRRGHAQGEERPRDRLRGHPRDDPGARLVHGA